MASDDTVRPDRSLDEPAGATEADIDLPTDTYGEIRVELRTAGAATESSESDAGEREILVYRYDPAAARCGRWGDEQWR